ncbi:MAG: glycerol-3-phosphate 1-O-acyltransferase PlsY [Alistipes sp.]|nr:glycerol-3-phosphate 1-O-acyltransferase PlsY [Alistipes sp.]MBQ7856655.1 glycerol-3-phosphate 1-O-acyltransferase PlsY [Alistipes sp.]
MVTTYYCVIALLITAYVLGSISSAVWISKRYYGIDIREHGSKNAGATNMLRVLGRRAAIPVFIIDFLKGFVAVNLMSLMRFDESISPAWLTNLKIIAVFVAVIGHIFPVFASFKGGKGVATLVGAITGIQPNIALFCLAVWIVVFLAFHYVSLASIIAGCSFPIFVTIFTGSVYSRYGDASVSFVLFAVVVAVLLLWTHRKNIGRMLDGTEPKLYIWKEQKQESDNTTK